MQNKHLVPRPAIPKRTVASRNAGNAPRKSDQSSIKKIETSANNISRKARTASTPHEVRNRTIAQTIRTNSPAQNIFNQTPSIKRNQLPFKLQNSYSSDGEYSSSDSSSIMTIIPRIKTNMRRASGGSKVCCRTPGAGFSSTARPGNLKFKVQLSDDYDISDDEIQQTPNPKRSETSLKNKNSPKFETPKLENPKNDNITPKKGKNDFPTKTELKPVSNPFNKSMPIPSLKQQKLSINKKEYFLIDKARVQIHFPEFDDIYFSRNLRTSYDDYIFDADFDEDFSDLIPKLPFPDENQSNLNKSANPLQDNSIQINSKFKEVLESKPLSKSKQKSKRSLRPSSLFNAQEQEKQLKINTELSYSLNSFTDKEIATSQSSYVEPLKPVVNLANCEFDRKRFSLEYYYRFNVVHSERKPLHFYSNQMRCKLPVSYVPYFPIEKIKSMNVVLDTIGLSSPFLHKNIKDHNKPFPVIIGSHCSEIPLSSQISKPTFPSLNSLGHSLEKLGAFPFISEKLFPFELNVQGILSNYENLNTNEEKSQFTLAYASNMFSSTLNPYSFMKYNDIPLYSSLIKIRSNDSFIRAYLLPNRILVGDYTMEINELTHADILQSKCVRICNYDREFIFDTNEEFEASLWVSSIKSLVLNSNVSALNLHLFILSSHHPSTSIQNQIIAAVISPFILFSVVLLSKENFKNYVLDLFNILKSENQIDFFMRSIILAEFTLNCFDKVFCISSNYSRAIIAIFTSVSKKWLDYFVGNYINNDISRPVDLLSLVYSLFSLINDESLYVIRCIVLYSCAICPAGYHPMIPFFNLLKASIRTYQVNTTFSDFDELIQNLVKSPYENRTMIELIPFTNKIIQTIPKIEGNKNALNENADAIYKYLLDNINKVLPEFKVFANINISKNPVVMSYYQNLLFLLRDFINI
ncbi:hypothetical protein TRFO_29017 [Tritrichomonas foetus]|uniref:Uncharacterized protein n=1 Tax=Tritrichomonas foetus TaxID=1144522 RepID=A0A1J4JWQ8_9EUKA|nr:hypothetical protein TRFO_29017 [Tritrichomonas foetus]|eukprot:OHT03583.1 hypothetical protein TRFO_29017 [Tritrichomonas foetus]